MSDIPPPPAGYTVTDDGIPPPPPGYTVQIAPTQFLSAPSSGSRIPTSGVRQMGDPRADTWEGAAPASAVLSASMTPDPQKKIAIYAKSMGVDPRRFGVDHDGNIGYMGPQGWQLAVPTVRGGSLSNPVDLARRLGANGAADAGQLGEGLIGAGVGAVVGGPPGAIAGALTTGGADVGRQMVGNGLAGTPIGDISYANAAGNGLLAGASDALGKAVPWGINKAFGSNPLKMSAFDASKITPENLAQWQANAQAGADLGIPMTPADVTGLRSLRVQERRLGRLDEAGDTLSNFYANRNTQAFPQAASNVFGTISPTGTPQIGAADMKAGAQKVLDGILAKAQASGSPHYEKAFSSGVTPDISSAVDKANAALQSWPVGSDEYNALTKIKGLLQKEVATQAPDGTWVTQMVPQDDMRVLHGAKMSIDKMPSLDPVIGSDSTLSGQIEGIGNDLRDTLVNSSPDYAAGNKAYVDTLPQLDQAKNGLVGYMANSNVTPDQAVAVLRNAKSGDVQAAKDMFEQYGAAPNWASGVRSYLENSLDTAGGTLANGSVGNVPGKFQKAVAGTGQQQDSLMTAAGSPTINSLGATGPTTLTPGNDLDKLLGVSRNIAGTLAEGSPTPTDLMAGKYPFASGGARVGASVIRSVNPFDIPDMLADAWLRNSNNKGAADLARTYTTQSPTGLLNNLGQTQMVVPYGTQKYLNPALSLGSQWGYRGLLDPNYPAQAPAISGASELFSTP